MDPKERKRNQNRVAQRTYRRNQKERIRSLEEAAGQRMPRTQQLPPTPAASDSEQTWLSAAEDDFLSFPVNGILNAPQVDMIERQSPPPPSSNDSDPFNPFFTSNLPSSPLPRSNSRPRTSLHRAIAAQQESITRLLLAQGADTTKQNSDGLPALHLAVAGGHEGIIRVFLDQKSTDLNVVDAMGQTALFKAVQGDNERVVRMLLEDRRVDVNSRDSFGDVALHLAVERGNEGMVGCLLGFGADVDA